MTLRTPDEVPDCVKSSVFMELAHDWTLQPPLAAYLDIHRSISVCSWCSASLNGVRRKRPAHLPRGTRVPGGGIEEGNGAPGAPTR